MQESTGRLKTPGRSLQDISRHPAGVYITSQDTRQESTGCLKTPDRSLHDVSRHPAGVYRTSQYTRQESTGRLKTPGGSLQDVSRHPADSNVYFATFRKLIQSQAAKVLREIIDSFLRFLAIFLA
jgi:hypothetical protein